MTVSLTDEQAKNWAASLRNGAAVMKNIADVLDPLVYTRAGGDSDSFSNPRTSSVD